MDLVEHLGVEGTLGVIPLRENPFSVGWGASVEMIGLVDFLTLLPLSLVAGVVTLAIGVTRNIDSTFIWLKESEERELAFLQSSMAVLQPEAQNEKAETWV